MSALQKHELCLSFGDLSFHLLFKDETLFRDAERRYGCFRNETGDFPIFVDHSGRSLQTGKARTLAVMGSRLSVYANCALFDNVERDYQLDGLLRVLLTLKLAEQCGLLLHASTVIDRGTALVFAGQSGAGKSTIAELSLPRTVFTDEISLIRMAGKSAYCYSTPFWGSFKLSSVCQSAPLGAIFTLVQSGENRVERLNFGDAFKVLLKNQLFFARDRTILDECLRNASAFALHVPVFKLCFRRETSVWDVIRAAMPEAAHESQIPMQD